MKFRKDTWDRLIAINVIGHNEYGLPRWMQGQTVIDIGAHIGSFSIACRARGASLIYAYEPDPENFEMLVLNDKEEQTRTDCKLVLCHNAVLGGNMMSEVGGRRLRNHDFEQGRNTGHVQIEVRPDPEEAGEGDFQVIAVGINSVIREALKDEANQSGVVDILKLDCEGSEWDILRTGDFSKVRLVVGELHKTEDDFGAQVREGRRALRKQGFDVEVNYESPETAKFVAINSSLTVADAAKPEPGPVKVTERKPRLLWWGDAEAGTGYSRVTENICTRLAARGWDIHVLGIGYSGDPHKRPYTIYPAHNVPIGVSRVDAWGNARIKEILGRVKPDLLLIQNDHWIIADCLGHLSGQNIWVPTVGYVAVDSENVRLDNARQMNNLRHVITHTQFGADQLKAVGHTGPFTVIPHGVDTSLYRPYNKLETREGIKLKNPEDAFIFGYVNANQPRKRLDLAMAYFASWFKAAGQPDNTWLYLHTNIDGCWDWVQLADFLGLRSHILTTGEGHLPEDQMPALYNALDVMISTSEGESFGLTTLEGMACGIPQIAVRCGGMPEWAADAVEFVEPSFYGFTSNRTNTLRHMASESDYTYTMQRLYGAPDLRADIRARGLKRAAELTWESAAAKFDSTLRAVIAAEKVVDDTDVLAEFA